MTEWNSRAYARLSNPMQTWGEAIVAELPLRGDETALDLGCGDGRLTQVLVRRLPRGHVIAVDPSANMLDAAGPWEFASPELAAQRLKDAGFVDVETSTFEAPRRPTTISSM